jgi:hypothetical protein
VLRGGGGRFRAWGGPLGPPNPPPRPPHKGQSLLAPFSAAAAAQHDAAQPSTKPAGGSLAASVGPQVIFTNITGDPSSNVPGHPGVSFKAGTAGSFIEDCFGSPNGNWVLTAQTDLPTTQDEILFSNSVVRIFEADPIPALGANVGLIDRHCGVNDVGQLVWSTDTDGPLSEDEVVLTFDPAGNLGVFAQEGDGVPGVPGALYGPSILNTVLLRDGTIGLSGEFSGTLPSNVNEFLLLGSVALLQEGVSVPPGQIGSEVVQNFRAESFRVTPSGSRYAVLCDLGGPTNQNNVVVVDGAVVLQEGVCVVSALDPNPIGNGLALAVTLDAAGNWYARGNNANSGNDWVVRNGVVVAETGASVAGGSEVWDDAAFAAGFFLQVGNGVGDWVVGGCTDGPINANHVLVLNGTTVILRENDPLDLDGNGLFDDDTRIANFGGFVDDRAFLTDGGEFYFVATLRTDFGSSKGMGFFRIDLDPGTQNYCTSGPTSLGEPAVIRMHGSTSVAADDLVLTVSPVPPSSVGLFFYGPAQTSVPFGNGTRCVDAGGVGLFRLAGQGTGIGFLEEQLDIANPVAPLGQITPGSTWNFQGWFRDTAAGGAMFDLSDAIGVTFTP